MYSCHIFIAHICAHVCTQLLQPLMLTQNFDHTTSLIVINKNNKWEIYPAGNYFFVLKKSLPFTLVTTSHSEVSAAVDDFLRALFVSESRFSLSALLCLWKASEIMFPSVSTCAPVTSPFGGNHVSVGSIRHRVSTPAKCSGSTCKDHPTRVHPNFC